MTRQHNKHTITLYLGDGGYLARHSNPSVKQLLGTDTLPTAFTREADPHTVLTEIQRLNPGRLVQLADSPSDPPTKPAPFHSDRRERPTESAANVPQAKPSHSERSERPNP
jgi:hypothetical protein